MRLVYGLGATKSGSGWLYRFLRAHPDCHLRTIKELHFFDTMEFRRTRSRVRKLRRNLGLVPQQPVSRAMVARMSRDLEDWIPVVESGDAAAYLRYLADGRADRTLIADITPGYALVSADTLRRMDSVLPETRFVYFMRDPVARMWSHVRMVARRAARSGADAGQVATEVLNRALTGSEPSIVARGTYDVILPRLKSVVPADRLYVDFFEDVVPPAATGRLCAFLGIAPLAAGSRHPHEGMAVPLAPEQRDRMLAYLAPQYDFVRSEMGRLPKAWEASMARA